MRKLLLELCRQTVLLIFVTALLLLVVVTGLFLTKPAFVWNMFSNIPRLVVDIPFNQSLERRSMENAANLLARQVSIGKVIGENDFHGSAVEKNLNQYLDHASRTEDYEYVSRLFSDNVLELESDNLKGAWLLSTLYGNPNGEVDDELISSLSEEPSLRRGEFERFLLGWQIVQKEKDEELTSFPGCTAGEDKETSLDWISFNSLKRSGPKGVPSVPIMFGEYWNSTDAPLFSTPVNLRVGRLQETLRFSKRVSKLRRLRFHIYSKPGTIIEIESAQLGGEDIINDENWLLLKTGYFLDSNRMLLTSSHDMLTILSNKTLKSPETDIVINLKIGLAEGIRKYCE